MYGLTHRGLLVNACLLACWLALSAAPRGLATAVYHYWAMKRTRAGPLLRCFQSFPLLGNWQRQGSAPAWIDPTDAATVDGKHGSRNSLLALAPLVTQLSVGLVLVALSPPQAAHGSLQSFSASSAFDR